MTTRTFKYEGGIESIEFNVNSTSLPLRYEINSDCNWIKGSIEFNTLTIDVSPTYDYNSRETIISVFNANNKKIDIKIHQEGFDGINIDCDSMVVVNRQYFNTNKYYPFYVTVYGGETQELSCPKLKDKIEKVWDNSDMYNDFIIRIPEGFEGKYILKHSEYTKYKKYCKDNSIHFDESKVKKTIEIVMLDKSDGIGEMIVEYNGVQYNTYDSIPVTISNDSVAELKVISETFIKPISFIEYEVVDSKDFELDGTPRWLDIEINSDKIKLSANEKNIFGDRYGRVRIINSNNKKQYVYLNIKQESGT